MVWLRPRAPGGSSGRRTGVELDPDQDEVAPSGRSKHPRACPPKPHAAGDDGHASRSRKDQALGARLVHAAHSLAATSCMAPAPDLLYLY